MFTRVRAYTLADSQKGTFDIGGSSRFITSTAAPTATGRSDRGRVGFAPTGRRSLFTAHIKAKDKGVPSYLDLLLAFKC